MKYFIVSILLVIFISQPLISQNIFKAVIKDRATQEPLAGASAHIESKTLGDIADANGLVTIQDIPTGKYTIIFSFMGYKEEKLQVLFPQQTDDVHIILMEASQDELDEVVVTSTRSSRSIANIPTRIEAIVSAELEEKTIMQPSSIRMLLTESTGIQTQQTSQISGSASIRIQGLDGKYTQLLQDGLPLYSGFAGGLSILQIPPLNLKRVEIIKGSSSTLYGGGAIAGLINLITKTPEQKKEISVLLNANTTSAQDASVFYSQQYGKTGLVFYTSGNFQKAYDANKDGFSDVPEFDRYTINPKFFFNPDKNTSFGLGISAGFEKRKGGDMLVLKGLSNAEHIYFEKNNSNRYSTQANFDRTFSDKSILTVKNSIGYFKRSIGRHDYDFEGEQVSTFTEANYLIPKEYTEWNIGLNYLSDDFKQLNINSTSERLNYTNSVFGAFAQNNYTISSHFIVESGLRLDFTNRNDFFALPRLSLLYKINPKLTSRIGGGLGYKMPSIFSEDSEERAFRDILPLNFDKIKPERSYGINADIDYKTTFADELFFGFNQMFYYTVVREPLILEQLITSEKYSFVNADGNIQTRGFETNIRLKYDDISCFLGYTFTDAVRKFDNTSLVNPLTSKHRINANLMYEIDNKLRIAYELFYFGKQYLSSGTQTRDYWVMGTSAQYEYRMFTFFINFENFLDVRQSRWEPMYTGTIQNPRFKEIYAPTDGFVANAGIRITL